VIVLGVGDRALERLLHKERGLLRAERHNVERRRHRAALDLTRHVADLEGGHARKSIDGFDFHFAVKLLAFGLVEKS
jgi:hypothetical protein